MELLQSRRSALRVEIRRRQVDALMRTKREQLTFTDQHQRILDMINEGLHTRPASIFSDLIEYYHGCSKMEGKAFAHAVWKYLVSSNFRKSSISCQGLPQLLTSILPLLTQHERRQLPCKLLPVLFQYFWDSSDSGACGDGQLLDIALLISLDASKQSQCQLSLRQQEIQAVICKAHQELSIGSIQLLLFTLANLEQEAVGRHWKAMLQEIARRAVGWLDD